MHRINLNLTGRQWKQLNAEAKELGIPLGELIRRYLDSCIDAKLAQNTGKVEDTRGH